VESKITQAWSTRRRCRRVPALRSSFAGFHFPPDVITLAVRSAVRWYLRYGLSDPSVIVVGHHLRESVRELFVIEQQQELVLQSKTSDSARIGLLSVGERLKGERSLWLVPCTASDCLILEVNAQGPGLT
jgi:hypothetical protein